MVLSYIVFLLGASALSAHAQSTTPAPAATPTLGASPLPLTQYTFTYPNLPEQVNPYPTGRGPQYGYNVCNATTEGPDSKCQTMFVNDITDFCIWGSDIPDGAIGNIEAQVVAYCTKPGHGTRIIPPGTFTAVQFIKAPGYIQVTGLFNQSGINLQAGDAGGELDPHGADLFGNPLGGLVFSNNLPSSQDNTTIKQVNNWSNFVGGNQFCIKACDPTINSPDYCQNIYDTQGCAFNMPASYTPNLFLSCLGDNQQPPGASPAVIPATSSCTTYTSSLLYPNTASTAAGGAATGSSGSGSSGSSGSGSSGSSKPATSGSSSGAVVIGKPSTSLFAITSTLVVAALAGVVIVL